MGLARLAALIVLLGASAAMPARADDTPGRRADETPSRVIAAASARLDASPAPVDVAPPPSADHPGYDFEVEAHGVLGWDDVYASTGFGGGVRFSVPVVDNGFFGRIDDSVALTFGVDLLRYERCWYHGDCVGTYLQLPIALQWNFYVSRRVSLFVEPGIVIYRGFYDPCPAGVSCPQAPPVTSAEPSFSVGGRYYLDEKVALTLRAGFPSVTFGLSAFP